MQDCALAESKNKTPSLKVKLRTSEGELYHDFYLSDKAFENSIKNLREAFSFDGDFSNLDQFLDQECQIVVEHEEYNDELRARVRYVNHKDGRGVAKLDEAKAKSLAETLNSKARRLIEAEEKSDTPL